MGRPRTLSDDEVREAYRRYVETSQGLRLVARSYGISHVQLGAAFRRLKLEVRGNHMTDPRVVDRVISERDSGATWPMVAASTGLSLRQVQNVYAAHTQPATVPAREGN